MTPADVVAQMLAADMPEPPQPLDLSGRRIYFGPKKKCWYVLREYVLRSGRVVLSGCFGDYKRGDWSERVEWGPLQIDPEERAALREKHRVRRASEDAERARRADWAALQGRALWRRAAAVGHSPYLARKGVTAEAVRYLPDGTLVVPLLRYDRPREAAFAGAQTIGPDGSKRFTPGTAKRGAACRLGLAAVGGAILLCEGLATGLSIRMATDRRLPVWVAFDAGNLAPVAQILRAAHPGSWLLICADDDWLTPGNPGLTAAYKAAADVGADVTHPVFAHRPPGVKWTDYNDLHIAEGLPAVRAHFDRILTLARQAGRHAA